MYVDMEKHNITVKTQPFKRHDDYHDDVDDNDDDCNYCYMYNIYICK